MLTPFNLAAALLIRLWPSTRLCFGRIFALGELLVVALFGHGLLLLSFRVVKDIGSPRGLTLALLLVLALGGLMAVVILVQRRRARTRPTATLWKPAATLVVLSLGGTAAYATLASATPEEPATTGAPALVPASAIASPSLLPAVILLSIDTLRADHLGSYGYERETTPARDRMHPVCAGPQSFAVDPSLTCHDVHWALSRPSRRSLSQQFPFHERRFVQSAARRSPDAGGAAERERLSDRCVHERRPPEPSAGVRSGV